MLGNLTGPGAGHVDSDPKGSPVRPAPGHKPLDRRQDGGTKGEETTLPSPAPLSQVLSCPGVHTTVLIVAQVPQVGLSILQPESTW